MCVGTVFATLWKQEEGLLPPIESDPKFAGVLEDITTKPAAMDQEEGGW
jgi:hypothetical protein